MSGPSNETTKLVATAASAAVAGAALGIATLRLWEKNRKQPLELASGGRPYNGGRPVFYKEKITADLDDSAHHLLFPHNHEEKMRRRIAARTIVEEDNFQPRDSVTVRVPASSANMGPGCAYDIKMIAVG